MKFIYTLLTYLALPLALLRLVIKSRHNSAYRHGIMQRFGKNLPAISLNPNQKLIWIHSVSVGEFLASLPLIELLLSDCNIKLVITTTTPTGSAQVTEKLAKYIGDTGGTDNASNVGNYNSTNSKVYHCYFPYDIPLFCNNFLRHFNPEVGVFVETEIWPNILGAMNKKNIPALLINARLSEKSFARYLKLGKFTQKTLQLFALIACQNIASENRFSKLGANTKTLGNLKFDIKQPIDLAEKQAQILQLTNSADFILFASTHDDEESQILETLNNITAYNNNKLLIVIAPRHPERSREIAKLCQQKSITCTTLSQLTQQTPQKASIDNGVLLIDKLGELIYLYSLAKIAIIGGSFVKHGGHNPLEACLFAKPTIIGTHVFNFQTIVDEMLANNAIIQTSIADLAEHINSLLNENNAESITIGNNGLVYLEQNQGAIQRYYDLILYTAKIN